MANVPSHTQRIRVAKLVGFNASVTTDTQTKRNLEPLSGRFDDHTDDRMIMNVRDFCRRISTTFGHRQCTSN